MKHLYLLILIFSFLSAKDRVVLFLSKSKAFLNEPILTKFVIKSDNKPKYITLQKFSDNNFYDKLIKEGNITKVHNYYQKEYYYLLAPQATGDINIPPIEATISLIQEKTGFLIHNSYKTKPKTISVFDIPSGLNISGNLNIHLKQENNTTKPKEPIYYTLTIEGYGNLDDIKAFKLPLKGATYFTDKPRRIYSIKDNKKLQGTFIQKFTVIANNSFKIEPIKFKYFNTQTQLEETLYTMPINVKIDKPLLKKKEWIILGVGFILGVILTILFLLIKRFKKKPSNLALAIKMAKSQKELYNILLPYSNNPKLKKYIDLLEENLYKKAKHKIKKRDIINEL